MKSVRCACDFLRPAFASDPFQTRPFPSATGGRKHAPATGRIRIEENRRRARNLRRSTRDSETDGNVTGTVSPGGRRSERPQVCVERSQRPPASLQRIICRVRQCGAVTFFDLRIFVGLGATLMRSGGSFSGRTRLRTNRFGPLVWPNSAVPCPRPTRTHFRERRHALA